MICLSFLSILSAYPQEFVTCTSWRFIIYIDVYEVVFVISSPEDFCPWWKIFNVNLSFLTMKYRMISKSWNRVLKSGQFFPHFTFYCFPKWTHINSLLSEVYTHAQWYIETFFYKEKRFLWILFCQIFFRCVGIVFK